MILVFFLISVVTLEGILYFDKRRSADPSRPSDPAEEATRASLRNLAQALGPSPGVEEKKPEMEPVQVRRVNEHLN